MITFIAAEGPGSLSQALSETKALIEVLDPVRLSELLADTPFERAMAVLRRTPSQGTPIAEVSFDEQGRLVIRIV